jgi:hypothetical protein
VIGVLINPGAGPVSRATLKGAWKNVRALRRAVDLDRVQLVRQAGPDDREGRYLFVLHRRRRHVDVLVPGCELELLTSDRPFPPRLYVHGNSYTWWNAVDIARGALR